MKTKPGPGVLDSEADRLNALHPIGTPVRYREVLGHAPVFMSKTRSRFWVLCGQVVVMIEGKSGGVAASHLEFVGVQP